MYYVLFFAEHLGFYLELRKAFKFATGCMITMFKIDDRQQIVILIQYMGTTNYGKRMAENSG